MIRRHAIDLILSITSGVLFGLAFPDVGAGWLSFICLAPLLVVVIRAKRGRSAFLYGWISQTTAWLLMVPWVVRVMSHYGGLPQIVGVLLFIVMALYLGLYGGVFALLVHRFHLGVGFSRWLLVPVAWAAVEFGRTHLLTGFPWNLIATAIVNYASLLQIDRAVGPYFLGAMIVLPSTILAWWITQRPPAVARVVVAGALGILMLVWWGTGLIATKLTIRRGAGEMVVAALLQPNISQEMRWDNENVLAIYQRMIAMTVEAANRGARIVVWPESTVPLSFTETAFFRESIEELSRERKIDIILGSVATDPRFPGRLWNSAFLVSNGNTIGHYDKIRLVPFGEYVPLRRLLFFAEKLVHAVGEFEFGANDRPLNGLHRYGLAICYEVVFPQVTRQQIRNDADVLVTITNDAWYDGTSAPEQHLWQARMRAVEGDRYILRAATTGISALIDPTGQVVQSIPMGQQGIVYAQFHPRTALTPYVRFGDWFAWGSAAMVLIALVRIGAGRRREARITTKRQDD